MTKTCGCIGCTEDATHVIERDGKRWQAFPTHQSDNRVIEFL